MYRKIFFSTNTWSTYTVLTFAFASLVSQIFAFFKNRVLPDLVEQSTSLVAARTISNTSINYRVRILFASNIRFNSKKKKHFRVCLKQLSIRLIDCWTTKKEERIMYSNRLFWITYFLVECWTRRRLYLIFVMFMFTCRGSLQK